MTLNIISEIKKLKRSDQKPSKVGIKCKKIQKTITPLKFLALGILFITPIFKKPTWCYSKPNHICDGNEVPISDVPYLNDSVCYALYILGYIILGTFVIMRLFIKKVTKSAIIRSAFMLTLMLAGIIDLSICIGNPLREFSPATDFINVVLILFFVRSVREVWFQIGKVVKDSIPVISIIMAFIVFCSYIGYILFAGNEDNSSFVTVQSALYTNFQIFTVTNYPDI